MPADSRHCCCEIVAFMLPETYRVISTDYVQGQGVYDTCHQGYLQAAAYGLCQGQQSFRGGYAV